MLDSVAEVRPTSLFALHRAFSVLNEMLPTVLFDELVRTSTTLFQSLIHGRRIERSESQILSQQDVNNTVNWMKYIVTHENKGIESFKDETHFLRIEPSIVAIYEGKLA